MNTLPAAVPSRVNVGTLVWSVPVRLLDVSRSGCRLESSRWLGPGTSGQLALSLRGEQHEDDVRVARCQLREGAGAVYLVGVELLYTRRLDARSIRLAISHLIGEQEAPPPLPSTSGLAIPDRESEQQIKGVSRAPPAPADAKT